MIKNIIVSLATHPEFYRKDLNLGLDMGPIPEVSFDVGGDVVTVDTDRNLIYRLPLINGDQVHLVPKDDPIWKSINLEGEVC
jgi:hypothetical protein